MSEWDVVEERPQRSNYDLVSQHFPEDAVPTALKIMKAESAGKHDAVNRANRNGTTDSGLFQINDVNVKALQDAGIITSKDDLMHPETNVAAAAWLHKRDGFKPWKASEHNWGKADDWDVIETRDAAVQPTPTPQATTAPAPTPATPSIAQRNQNAMVVANREIPSDLPPEAEAFAGAGVDVNAIPAPDLTRREPQINVPKWGQENPTLYGVAGAAYEASKPIIEAGGLVLGATLGTPAGPAGAVGGGALGYGAARQAMRIPARALGVEEAPRNLPEALMQGVGDVAEGATMEMGGQITGKVIPSAINALKPKFGDAAINAVIDKGINKGVRPSVVGKGRYSLADSAREKSREAVKTIVDNRANLMLEDETGAIVQGQLPQSLRQFSQAIEQTKRSIFEKYNAMAGKDITIDLKGIGVELRTIGNGKALQDNAPDIAKYAQDRAASYSNRGTYTAQEAQDAMAILNKSLEAFYKNPSYEGAAKAYIDSLIVNNMRRSLDKAITEQVGPGYLELRRTYGALKSIEKDVANRMTVDARKNIKGLLDFSDVFSAYHVAHGLASLNPATVGSGVFAKMVAGAYKRINDPNTIIKNMFSTTEKLMSRQRPPVARGGEVPDVVTSVTPPRQIGYEPFTLKGEPYGAYNRPMPQPRAIPYDPRATTPELQSAVEQLRSRFSGAQSGDIRNEIARARLAEISMRQSEIDKMASMIQQKNPSMNFKQARSMAIEAIEGR